MTSAQAKGQTAMDERQVEDAQLEDFLDTRADLLDQRRVLNKDIRVNNELISTKVEQMGLKVGQPIRVGIYRLEKKETEPRHVEFDTEGKERLTITGDHDEEHDEPEAPEELRDLLPDMPE